MNHRLSKIFAPIFERPFDSSNRSLISIKPSWSWKVIPNLKSASFVVRPSRSCRDATQITTRRGAQKAMSSTGERAARCRRCMTLTSIHSIDYVSSAHLEDSDPYPRKHEHQGQPYRQGNPADGGRAAPCRHRARLL